MSATITFLLFNFLDKERIICKKMFPQLFGLLLFGEVPGALKVIGVCLVFASIVSIAARDAFLKKWKIRKEGE